MQRKVVMGRVARSRVWRGVVQIVALAAFLLLGGAIVGAQTQGSTLVSNTGQANADAISFHEQLALKFTTGNHAHGYTLNAIEVGVTIRSPEASPTYPYSVTIKEGSGASPGDHVGALTSPTLRTGVNNFTSADGIDLEPNTSYFVHFWRGRPSNNAPYLDATLSDNEDSGGAANWTIGNSMIHRSSGYRPDPGSLGFIAFPNWVAFTADSNVGSAVVEMNIKGSAKTAPPTTITSTDTTMPSSTTPPTVKFKGEPGSEYNFEGETRTVDPDGTYDVRMCIIYNEMGIPVGRIYGGTGPCP